MSTTIITKDNDMLDALSKAHYGREDRALMVLAANPHLARLPAVLSAGVTIVLPQDATAEDTESAPEVRIWG